MRALRLDRIGSLLLESAPEPNPGSEAAALGVTHCAVCRTDAKIWERGHRDLVLPRIPGHEIFGVNPEDGKRYAAWPGTACGRCAQCRGGAENLCREMRIIGFHEDGGFAESVAVPEKSLIAVPDDLPGELACMAEPMACAVNGLERAGTREGDRVLIQGAGPVGLMVGLAAQAMGGIPFIREINPRRMERVREFLNRAGIDILANHSESDFDRTINAAPDSATLAQGFSRLKPGGTFCLFSGLTDDAPLSLSTLNQIHYRQLRLVGAYGCTRIQMVKALGIIADHRDAMELLIEDRIPLERVPEILPKILAGESLKFIIELSPGDESGK